MPGIIPCAFQRTIYVYSTRCLLDVPFMPISAKLNMCRVDIIRALWMMPMDDAEICGGEHVTNVYVCACVLACVRA